MISLVNANALAIPLADKSVHCVVTSPPYWALRDYGVGGQLGLEQTPEEYVANMVAVFREVWRVLRDDGVLFMNLGDCYASSQYGSGGTNNSYADKLKIKGVENYKAFESRKLDHGLKEKDLVGIPWRVAFALQADVWYLRSDIIWHKPNPMPESVTDRPTKSHEYVFMLTKQARYFWDQDAVREEHIWAEKDKRSQLRRVESKGKTATGVYATNAVGYHTAGRNIRSVWTIPTESYSGSHYATYPRRLVEPCVKAGTSERGCCPKCGAQWVRVVEREAMVIDTSAKGKIKHEQGLRTSTSGTMVKPPHSTILGFRPGCDCDAGDPIPSVVFDPFAGSGTTLLVARALGRRAVGLDLSMAYLRDNASERLGFNALKRWSDGGITADADMSGLPMFTERKNDENISL